MHNLVLISTIFAVALSKHQLRIQRLRFPAFTSLHCHPYGGLFLRGGASSDLDTNLANVREKVVRSFQKELADMYGNSSDDALSSDEKSRKRGTESSDDDYCDGDGDGDGDGDVSSDDTGDDDEEDDSVVGNGGNESGDEEEEGYYDNSEDEDDNDGENDDDYESYCDEDDDEDEDEDEDTVSDSDDGKNKKEEDSGEYASSPSSSSSSSSSGESDNVERRRLPPSRQRIQTALGKEKSVQKPKMKKSELAFNVLGLCVSIYGIISALRAWLSSRPSLPPPATPQP